jgi:hypothetical protein
LGRWIAVAIGLFCLAGALAAKPPGPRWTTVTLNTDPGTSSRSMDINDAGDVVGVLYTSKGRLPVLWEVSGTTVVEHILADGTEAYGVNELREIVGRWGTDGAYWTSVSSRAVALPPLDGHEYAEAYELNDNGVIVGKSVASDGTEYPVAWRVVNGAVTGFIALPGGQGCASDLTNNDPGGVATVAGSASFRPVTWQVASAPDGSLSLVGGPYDVDPDALGYGHALGINEAGDVCGDFLFQGSSESWSAVRAFSGGNLAILQQVNERQPDDQNEANAINNARQAVGHDYSTKTGDNAILWAPNGSATQLSKVVSGWTRIYLAKAINNGGVIAAIGRRFGESEERALVMIPPP